MAAAASVAVPGDGYPWLLNRVVKAPSFLEQRTVPLRMILTRLAGHYLYERTAPC